MKFIIFLLLTLVTLFAESFELTNKQLHEIDSSGYTMIRDLADKSGTIVFDVDEDEESVMQKILNFDEYPKNIADVAKIKIYFYQENLIKAHIFIETFFINFDNYVIHDIDLKQHKISWYLDSTKENYFAKMQGYWKLKKVGKKTRIFYHNKLAFKSWIPSFIESYLFEKGLFKSTQWILD
jgi:ribosome-associated toxin RatA of RatAB toxin-antitoxin module